MSNTFSLDLVATTAQTLGFADEATRSAFLTTGQVDASWAAPKSTRIPMMMARRLTVGERMALDCALSLLSDKTQALVYASHHSELERNHRILSALAEQRDVSPTDFTLSVNNSAPGNLTIMTKRPLTVSAISASHASFGAALTEAYLMLQDQYEEVLVVDCDGAVPEFYHPHLTAGEFTLPFASAWLLRRGTGLEVSCTATNDSAGMVELPASLSAWRTLSQGAGACELTVPGQQLQLRLNGAVTWA